MAGDTQQAKPAWSPRLRKARIARLYERCGQGIPDEELIDDVGFSLLARCESILRASSRSCPACGSAPDWADGEISCPSCGWRCTHQAYRKSIKYKHLFAGGMRPFLEAFVKEFPAARDHRQRLILIDTLIHRYHWEADDGSGGGKCGACCLIEGKLKNIMPFLDGLSYGDRAPPEVQATRARWRRKWRARQNAAESPPAG